MSPRHSPQLPLLALSRAHSSLGAGEEALSAPGGWHSPGESQGKCHSPCQDLWDSESRYGGGRVCLDFQYLEFNWAGAWPPSSAASHRPRTPNVTTNNAIPFSPGLLHPVAAGAPLGTDVYGSDAQVLSRIGRIGSAWAFCFVFCFFL